MDFERLKKQIDFIVEVDKLKHVYRQTLLMNGSRNENDAEHSWHLALMAMILGEHSNDKNIDMSKVIKMVLIHDLVEIDAGDTFCYDVKGNLDKAEREQAAADRIFNILPSDQAKEIRELWDEFEEGKTPESQFAVTLDRLQGFLHNYNTEGGTWRIHGITKDKVIDRCKPIADGSSILWEYVKEAIEDSIKKGYLSI